VVPKQFAYMLTYAKALPAHLPDFYTYLLSYPNAKPTNVEDTFYWARVKFGLKPTLRVVQMVTISGNPTVPVAYAIAEKQLYSSHYFETALDLSFCVRGSDDPTTRLLSNHDHGFRAGRSDGRQGIGHSQGRSGPVGFPSPERAHCHQELAGS
jgi:hypothetical protein